MEISVALKTSIQYWEQYRASQTTVNTTTLPLHTLKFLIHVYNNCSSTSTGTCLKFFEKDWLIATLMIQGELRYQWMKSELFMNST